MKYLNLMNNKLINSIIGVYPHPSALGPDGRPVAYLVAEWEMNECRNLEDAKICRDYLASWPDGPQGHMLPLLRVSVILNLTRQAVQYQISKGYINAVRSGNFLLVALSQIETLKPIKAGRPKKITVK